MEEPSVLDYLKAKLMPWRGSTLQIPTSEELQVDNTGDPTVPEAIPIKQEVVSEDARHRETSAQTISQRSVRVSSLPWLSLLSFGLAVLAQVTLEPGPGRDWKIGTILYVLSAVGILITSWRGEWVPAKLPEYDIHKDPMTIRLPGIVVALPLAALAFLSFGNNQFNTLNVLLWLLSLFALIWAFWLPAREQDTWMERVRDKISKSEWRITVDRSWLVIFAGIALILFFRLYRLSEVPPEMFSDHAEKLLDVWDVLHGETRIFFPRNTGREAMQMYMTAATIQLFGTGYSHLSLKIGTVLAGLLTLPFLYLLGKELGSRKIGFLAIVFAGVAYWPNVISRVGLRFPLYPLFVAPTLYYLLRGIRTSNRNDFIISGLFLGIGLHGYTPIRILPIVVLVAIGIFLLHRQSRGVRRQTLWFLLILSLISLVVFLPLLRYAVENPAIFTFRSFSRLGSISRPLPGSAGQIFLHNLWDAITSFAWDNGNIWVVSLTHRPALDIVSAALFFSGVLLLMIRYLRRRHWLDLFLLLSVPLLMMPSILSLTFPEENPALNRLSGAIVPIFMIVAVSLDSLMSSISSRLGKELGPKVAFGFGVACVLVASMQNYRLVFIEYQRVFEQSSWNTSEMGQVVRQFTSTVGSPDTAWVVAYPHWVDTRLVGINAGFPLKDYAIWPEAFKETETITQAKLFLINLEDTESLENLRQLYPQGVLEKYASKVAGRDFYMFFIPPTAGT
jgi:hypothetical protein